MFGSKNNWLISSVKNAELTLGTSQSNKIETGTSMPPSGNTVGQLLDDDAAVGIVGCSDGEGDGDGEDDAASDAPLSGEMLCE